jgi:hypothetical protein
VFLGFCHSRRGLGTVAAGLLLFLASLWLGPNAATRREQLAISVSPFRADGQIHQAHTELVAAVRMANQYPLAGVGAGRYQSSIGTFYGELPDPNVNDIERDTQSGFGVLLGTVGYPAGLLWLLLLLAALATASERYFASQRSDPLALGAAGAVGVVLAGSAISDPFVRGVCWYAVLALASAFCPSPAAQTMGAVPLGSVRLLGWRALLLWGLVLGAISLGVGLRAQAPQAIAGMDGGSGSRPHAAPATPASASSAATTPAGGTEAAAPAATATPTVTFQTDAEFFRILNPEAAKTVTPPMESAKDPTGAKGVVLRIPDEKGKPPDGAEPDMKYGGATYELEMPKNLKCRVWMRVWWEGACGNSLFLRVEDGKPLVLGNDGTYNVWHWLAVPATVELKQGKNTLYVLNREDGIRLDQVLITGDAEYVPQGIEEE